MRFIATATLAFLALAVASYSVIFSVGVSPSVVNAGELERGEQKIISFNIFTASDEPLLVYFDKEESTMDFFNRGYREIMGMYSEAPSAAWVDVLENPAEIDLTKISAGRGWKSVSAVISVPKDAEPGYHIVTIRPRPVVFGGPSAPVGTSVVTVVSVSVLFSVKGEARRDGVILDTTGSGQEGEPFSLKTFFKNTGTLTLHATAKNRIYNINGTFFGEFESASNTVKPGTTAIFETPVYSRLSNGEYIVESYVSYSTGMAVKNSTINISEKAKVADRKQEEYPWFNIILIVIIIVVVIAAYRWLRGR